MMNSLKPIAYLLSIVALIGGALWTLAWHVAERPTTCEMRSALSETRSEIRIEIKSSLDAQSRMLDMLAGRVAAHGRKLDEVLERL